MSISLIFRVFVGALALFGLSAGVIVLMLASPLRRPPELASISEARKTLDLSQLPPLDRIQARDGTELAYRHYAAIGPAAASVAVVVHGSSGSSRGAVHVLSQALAARGVESYALDIRGHGASGTRGDIGHAGQLQDDLADVVAEIRKAHPDAPLTLIGHSSGGGFALRMAGSPIQGAFARTVLLAPYLGYDAPTSRPNAGGWAQADIPRVIAALLLNRLGVTWADALPVLAFAVPPNAERRLTTVYSFRLMRDFAASSDFRRDVAAARGPLTLFAGVADELMLADKYQEALGARIKVHLVDGIDHMGIVGHPAAAAMIADDVARSDLRS
ncbi:alpha/beta fold hydrolase [Bradyrhizobium sp. U87765 SZCCT0131]|uniref:alpha/beta hydrolase n=1 Tax=unclassified Bradyrhizobium TaxID=2631580 RepID=UPI001BAB1B54|nr:MULTISPECIES: alpha/beta fold hydrolase [unclassified Bradyrhizobium]MBR1218707.1 alpha/beta fold hydrolase [Bradyrhizobium sp. U87765 SZCCT0131]MBR1265534.1 alpha/beta fold hydrolase [Bradyrhizobium sp. U87765 SZCCT0134]MBR1304206.1 alpha/beta fold hydrolase [Bradyrhizobium sp. U87765 SZCCT0110]MBR1319811.1 alpha/beta fold hydrolase [Bradyrhizobium sp. U87765 SZCCT0109]MBR1348137.1 alpha/beta fold hydrolase [Bradyrhizobium sp. U87765 SZCCT0048]